MHIEFLDNGIMGTLGLFTLSLHFVISCNIVSIVGQSGYLFIIVRLILNHSIVVTLDPQQVARACRRSTSFGFGA